MSLLMPARRNRGFKLVELAVVIGLVIVVVGLLLPLNHKTHSPANRNGSANNLKQITLASINHADLNDGYLNGPNDAAFYQNYHISILPQMDNSPGYENIVAKGSAAARPFQPYSAPGDPTNGRGETRTSYIFNDLVFLEPTETKKGITYCRNRFPVSIVDLPSNTIAWLEAYSGTTSGNRDWATSPYCANTNHETFQLAPRARPTAALADRDQGFYESGIQVSLLDGSVRTLGAALQNSKTFAAALTPAGRDTLGTDW
jgi:hypothetical protein